MSVSKNQRALVLVNSLSKHSKGTLKFIYSFAERSGVAVTKSVLTNDYKSITVRTGKNATKAKFLTALKTAAKKRGIKAVDVFLQLHGSKNKFHFYDRTVKASELRDDIKALNLPNCLRLLYNTGCYGDTQHWKEMIDAGFTTTIGSKKINCTGATEFPSFCSLWQFNKKVKDIMAVADNPATRRVQDAAAKAYSSSFNDANSEKVVRGKKNLTISSPA